jgi:hypothetical protein
MNQLYQGIIQHNDRRIALGASIKYLPGYSGHFER